jgi:hypothetical protein
MPRRNFETWHTVLRYLILRNRKCSGSYLWLSRSWWD